MVTTECLWFANEYVCMLCYIRMYVIKFRKMGQQSRQILLDHINFYYIFGQFITIMVLLFNHTTIIVTIWPPRLLSCIVVFNIIIKQHSTLNHFQPHPFFDHYTYYCLFIVVKRDFWSSRLVYVKKIFIFYIYSVVTCDNK